MDQGQACELSMFWLQKREDQPLLGANERRARAVGGSYALGLHDKGVVPHLESPLPGWIGVGASPESVMGTAHCGFSLMLAIIAGPLCTESSATST